MVYGVVSFAWAAGLVTRCGWQGVKKTQPPSTQYPVQYCSQLHYHHHHQEGNLRHFTPTHLSGIPQQSLHLTIYTAAYSHNRLNIPLEAVYGPPLISCSSESSSLPLNRLPSSVRRLFALRHAFHTLRRGQIGCEADCP
jgi:hypothetical protein